MQFWQAIAYTQPDQLADFARLAEEFGFEGVASGDHFVTPARIESHYPYAGDGKPWVRAEDPSPEPLIQAAALAQVTTRLRFMVTVYILPMRAPVEAAKAIATAAVLSANRLVLGVGVGWMQEEFDLAGQEFRDRGRRCDEMLEIMRKLHSGEMVDHRGEFYELAACQMCPVPSEPVPVLIGGHSDRAFRRAARNGGWLGAHYEVDQIPPLVERYRKICAEQGIDPASTQIVVAANQLGGPDDVRRLEDCGVTALIHMPLTFHGQPASSLEDKRRAMEQFADQFLG